MRADRLGRDRSGGWETFDGFWLPLILPTGMFLFWLAPCRNRYRTAFFCRLVAVSVCGKPGKGVSVGGLGSGVVAGRCRSSPFPCGGWDRRVGRFFVGPSAPRSCVLRAGPYLYLSVAILAQAGFSAPSFPRSAHRLSAPTPAPTLARRRRHRPSQWPRR